jgi:uncharacterized protein
LLDPSTVEGLFPEELVMSIKPDSVVSTDILIKALKCPDAYPHSVDGAIEVRETHISIIFLAGEFAYKVKKPVKTEFLDYSTLALRKHYCEEEKRLDSRYADDIYVGVVPISWNHGLLRVDDSNSPIEYAVKMRRFPKGVMLGERIESGALTTLQVHQLAESIAAFHRSAAVCEPEYAAGWPNYFVKNLHQVIAGLQCQVDSETAMTLSVLHQWTDRFLETHLQTLVHRVEGGFIRECHGDLHLNNVILWQDRIIPFDGIEFNERLRWIDVLCDAAFLAMDLAFHDHIDWSRLFLNTYLERSGDYGSLVVLRPFLIYRSLIRALVATARSKQDHLSGDEREAELFDARRHVKLAYRFTLTESPSLWITHGVSGSGKSTLSQVIVQRHDAFRLRSDVERKRAFGLSPFERPTPEVKAKMYSQASNEKTYLQLEDQARAILRAGYSVIIDATFLKHSDRVRFHELAQCEGVPFVILDCHADADILRQRVTDRKSQNNDASDADIAVLSQQLAACEPLTDSERNHVARVPIL